MLMHREISKSAQLQGVEERRSRAVPKCTVSGLCDEYNKVDEMFLGISKSVAVLFAIRKEYFLRLRDIYLVALPCGQDWFFDSARI